MMQSTRIVTHMPLAHLWNDDGDVVAERKRYLSKASLRGMLREQPLRFCVADIGSRLRYVDVANCYEFWRTEAAPNIVDDPEAGFRPEDFPNGFAYVASEWSGGIHRSIVLLEKYH